MKTRVYVHVAKCKARRSVPLGYRNCTCKITKAEFERQEKSRPTIRLGSDPIKTPLEK